MHAVAMRQAAGPQNAFEALPDARRLDHLVSEFDGAAIWIEGTGAVGPQNAAASILLDHDGLDPAVTALGASARLTGQVMNGHFTRPAEAGCGVRRFDLVAIPSDEGVLILGNDTSAEANLIHALKASRALFRDLAMCSADFAFETDASGVFTWVSPKGALGYRPQDLNGRRANTMFAARSRDGVDPFTSRSGVEDQAVWLEDANGSVRAVRITLTPVINNVGAWKGVRGVARDVTDVLRFENRQRMTTAIVEAMRASVEPEDMLASAAAALADGCGAQTAWIYSRHANVNACAELGQQMDELTREIALRIERDGAEAPMVFSSGTWAGLGVAVRFRGQSNGAILIARNTETDLFDSEALELLRSVAPHMGVAIAQVQAFSQLKEQTRTDPLTGLLNRRGFCDDVGRRLAAARRVGRRSTLMLIDCDHFKAINDCLGHAAGDDLLIKVAKVLQTESRAGDLCVRLGGDEFALWLEDTDEAGAAAKSEAIARGFRSVSRQLSLALAVTPSIGLAEAGIDPGETMDRLMERADQAMYAAKRAGRNRVGVHRAGGVGGAGETKVLQCSKP